MTKPTEDQLENYEFFIRNERPEEYCGDPLQFYNALEVEKYAHSKSMMRIQEKITQRALQIAEIAPPARILDLGMGCGFSTTVCHLQGYQSVGLDLNRLFLTAYALAELNPIQAEMLSIPFKPESFDIILSISAVQWILAKKSPKQRKKELTQLAKLLAQSLRIGGKVVFQFYPKSDESMTELGRVIADQGQFEGTFIIDNPESPKKRKIFLYAEKIK
jgi:18S rRNA (guanine1575-N7)-methyltransferase